MAGPFPINDILNRAFNAIANRINVNATLTTDVDSLDTLATVSNLGPNSAEEDQRLLVNGDVVQFSDFHSGTTHVFWSSENAECRVTFDGSQPTIANGHIITKGSNGIWSVALATAARFIRTTGTSVVIHASQMRA